MTLPRSFAAVVRRATSSKTPRDWYPRQAGIGTQPNPLKSGIGTRHCEPGIGAQQKVGDSDIREVGNHEPREEDVRLSRVMHKVKTRGGSRWKRRVMNDGGEVGTVESKKL